MSRLMLILAATGLLNQACMPVAGGRPGEMTAVGVSPERYAAALTYDQFVASDTTHADIWHEKYEQAAPMVRELGPRLRVVSDQWRVLVVAESWCRDSYESVPHLARLADRTPNLELRMLRREDAGDLLAAFPLDGRSAVPLVLLLDTASRVRGVWIEQPGELRTLIATQRPRLCDEDLGKRVRDWRDRDGGRSTLNEVVRLLEDAAG